jgi:hypothetical protein
VSRSRLASASIAAKPEPPAPADLPSLHGGNLRPRTAHRKPCTALRLRAVLWRREAVEKHGFVDQEHFAEADQARPGEVRSCLILRAGTLLGGRGGEAATCLDYDAGAEPNRDDFERRSNRAV